MSRIIIFFLLFATPLAASKVRTLFNSLDPQSIPQHLAFYELYPTSVEGKRALKHAWSLLSGNNEIASSQSLHSLSPSSIQSLIDLVNKPANEETPLLSESDLQVIDQLAHHLPNRKLKGFYAKSEEDVLKLTPEDVDLARGLFLTQLGNDSWQQLRSYEAMIDLMALQILSRISLNASPKEKIKAISRLIFDEMGFRFPPHSLYAKDVDLYTFLPSVLDSRQGVCLGVSILYLSLAQRLDLQLEAVIPPGHIYVRWREGNEILNIETTARGIHIDSEEFLGIETRKLEQKNIKEVIGLAHINQASVFLKDKRYPQALESYEKALPYLSDYQQLRELLGLTYLFVGEIEKGKQLLANVRGKIPEHAVTSSSLVEDYLDGKVDIESIQTLFMHVDENRESILKKKSALEDTLAKYPDFRDAWQALATTWMQLHREKEALETLNQSLHLNSSDPTAQYYLAVLSAKRFRFADAWRYLKNSEKLVRKRDHYPKALKQLRQQLSFSYPE